MDEESIRAALGITEEQCEADKRCRRRQERKNVLVAVIAGLAAILIVYLLKWL